MGTRLWAVILLVIALVVAAYLLLRPTGYGGSSPGQPSPHAIDQAQ